MQKKLMATFLTLTTLISLGSPAAQANLTDKLNTLGMLCGGFMFVTGTFNYFEQDKNYEAILNEYGLTHQEAKVIIADYAERSTQDFESAQKANDAFEEVDRDKNMAALKMFGGAGMACAYAYYKLSSKNPQS